MFVSLRSGRGLVLVSVLVLLLLLAWPLHQLLHTTQFLLQQQAVMETRLQADTPPVGSAAHQQQ